MAQLVDVHGIGIVAMIIPMLGRILVMDDWSLRSSLEARRDGFAV